MTYIADEEPTHHIPTALQRKLVEAKEWYDRPDGRSLAYMDAEGDGSKEAVRLLSEIVEMCDQAWGFAKPLPKGKK